MLRLLSAAATIAAPGVLVGSAVVACDDENDPKTWVKRLDDPAQRGKAIKRLTAFYEDGMTKVGNKADDPSIKALLDIEVEPLDEDVHGGRSRRQDPHRPHEVPGRDARPAQRSRRSPRR